MAPKNRVMIGVENGGNKSGILRDDQSTFVV